MKYHADRLQRIQELCARLDAALNDAHDLRDSATRERVDTTRNARDLMGAAEPWKTCIVNNAR